MKDTLKLIAAVLFMTMLLLFTGFVVYHWFDGVLGGVSRICNIGRSFSFVIVMISYILYWRIANVIFTCIGFWMTYFVLGGSFILAAALYIPVIFSCAILTSSAIVISCSIRVLELIQNLFRK